MEEDDQGLRAKLTRQGEETLGKLAQDLLENPLITGALTRAFEAREKAVQAQEVAFGALNLPSAADLERLTRRIRSVSQRLEGIEDALDRVDDRIGGLGSSSVIERRLVSIEADLERLGTKIDEQSAGQAVASKGSGRAPGSSDKRLKTIEGQLTGITSELTALRAALPQPDSAAPSRAQERLKVEEDGSA